VLYSLHKAYLCFYVYESGESLPRGRPKLLMTFFDTLKILKGGQMKQVFYLYIIVYVIVVAILISQEI